MSGNSGIGAATPSRPLAQSQTYPVTSTAQVLPSGFPVDQVPIGMPLTTPPQAQQWLTLSSGEVLNTRHIAAITPYRKDTTDGVLIVMRTHAIPGLDQFSPAAIGAGALVQAGAGTGVPGNRGGGEINGQPLSVVGSGNQATLGSLPQCFFVPEREAQGLRALLSSTNFVLGPGGQGH